VKSKILFINQIQFGYHIDYLKYCKYLKADFDITYLCWDYNWDKIFEELVDIIYVSRSGNIIERNVRFIRTALRLLKYESFQLVFINYFRGCSIIPLRYNSKHRIHLDIRTGSVSRKSIARNIYNFFLRFESYFFKSISIISEGLQKLLKVANNAYILPLGADPIIVNRKPDHKLSLLYIGTFYNRRIEDTIVGLGMFIKQHPYADIHYTIIGSGWSNEKEQTKDKIDLYDLHRYVELKGYIPQKELTQYFEKTNVGISYVPITPWFEYQPATKTFEYLMAGMPVVATGTFENKKIVNYRNGLIIEDDPLSFADSLELMIKKLDDFDEGLIRESVVDYKWEIIVQQLKQFIFKMN
jgi:glycosyltransferase involved in cell wall biosynthesis